jgi:hypothetical protein
MTSISRTAVNATLLLGLGWQGTDPAAAQSAVRAGTEFQVNDDYMHFNALKIVDAVAMRDDGSFIVVWRSPYPTGIFGRRFDAMGVRQALEFRIDSATTVAAWSPALAMHSDGSFVVAWESRSYDPSPTHDIVARRFDADGSPKAAEFRVNSYTNGQQTFPAIAMDGAGAFVVIWSSENQDGEQSGVFGQRFEGSGTAEASEFQVNASTSESEFATAVAIDHDGDFVVTWSSRDATASKGAFARRFDAAGLPQAAEFEIDPSIPGTHSPLVAMHPDGGFLLTWLRPIVHIYGLPMGRLFDAAGDPQGTEFQISTYTVFVHTFAIAMNRQGNFVATWSAGWDVFARKFDSTGDAETDDFRVNSLTIDNDFLGAADLDDDGRFVIVWSRLQYCNFPCHGNYGDVFGQRFTSNAAPLDIDSDGSTAALTDGLLVLRFLFDFVGSALVNGAVSGACARCASATLEGYLDGLDDLDALDVDGDGTASPLSDGVLILRFLFGFHGEALTSGAVGSGCVRCDAATIEPYLEDLVSTGG